MITRMETVENLFLLQTTMLRKMVCNFFVQGKSEGDMTGRLASSMESQGTQGSAMINKLVRYIQCQFTIIGDEAAGHDNFGEAVRDTVLENESKSKLIVRARVIVISENDRFTLNLEESLHLSHVNYTNGMMGKSKIAK
jgi:hypothetical protein